MKRDHLTTSIRLAFLLGATATIGNGQTCPLAAGCLDPTFGSGGKVAYSVPTRGAVPSDLVTQSDGKTIALIGNVSNSSTYTLIRINPDGSLDDSFGANGMVSRTWGFTYKAFIYYAWVRSIAIQNVGGQDRILMVGYAPKVAGNKVQTIFRIDRLMSDGSVDTSFGSNGTLFLQLGEPKQAVVQSDQKIVAVTVNPTEVVRLTTSGSLDTTFGSGGRVASPDANKVAIAPNLSIVVAGWLYSRKGNTVSNNVSLRRYSSSGILDTTFGTNGVAVVSSSFQSFRLRSLHVDFLNNIVVGGRAENPSADFMDYAVARFTPAGFQDSSFDGDGIALAGFSAYQGSESTALVQSDGKIVLVGGVQISSSILDAGVVRFNYDGSLDGTFGTGGRTTFDIAGNDYVAIGKGGVMQMDPGCACEKIVVAGGIDYLTTFARLTTYLFLARLYRDAGCVSFGWLMQSEATERLPIY